MQKGVMALVCLLLAGSTIVRAQTQAVRPTLKEFIKQKKTQIEYLGINIVENQIYIELLKKGYRIAKEGTDIIHQAKNGEFNLHDGLYLSLKLVKSKFKSAAPVISFLEDNIYIEQQSRKLSRRFQQSGLADQAEVTFVVSTMETLRSKMSQSLDQLITVLTDRDLEMSDDERLHRLDELSQTSKTRSVFMQQFQAYASELLTARHFEKAEIESMKARYGLD
ncbi:hypothetical protein MKQ70_32465 [Chitinophaga sedimenti]|uniref:hypothetical protein n=1 Tax=Chitinophaga sedimenti TaxID=2033606 RepID=UPI0020049193|nr:hypothetical protein [Chitinophaga sedimenti]MCK7559431.1 hypothetical protein [Chitinophaga sedimenti]